MRSSEGGSNGGRDERCKSGGSSEASSPFGFDLVSVDMCYYHHDRGEGGESKKTILMINEYPNTGQACKVGHKKPFGWTQQKIIKFKIKKSMAKLVEITNTAWCFSFTPWNKGKDKKQDIAINIDPKKQGEIVEIVCPEECNIAGGDKKATSVYLRTTVILMGVDEKGVSHKLHEYQCYYTIVMPKNFP
mmetsp:Transcript_20216/g.36008  ORF Transcript_20216/g.36008 Transcript_20216/m.36008 type:complete len:189 (-) Transcript_20216:99-665(-)